MRPTAKQLLSSPIFSDIRQDDLEKPAPFKFVVQADRHEDLKQNYQTQEEIHWIDFEDEENIPDKLLYFQKMLLKEVDKVDQMRAKRTKK
jgi:hypothetical protein